MDELTKVERIFDDWAPTYERNSWYTAQGEIVLQHLPTELRGAVLDVGCGTGWLVRSVMRAHPGVRGVGIDLSRRMVEVARETAECEGVRGLEFRQLEWESADTESLRRLGPFGMIACVSVFHYFAEPVAALCKMRALLAPGGTLLLLDRDTEGSALTRVWNVIHRFGIRDHVRFHAASNLSTMMTEAGFARVQVRRRVNRFFWHGKIVSGLVLLSGVVDEPAVAATGS